MTAALILHGICDRQEYFQMDLPSPSNAHWLPWLQQNFLRSGVLCQTPEMPAPYAPDYQDWEKTFRQFSLSPDPTIVAHSAGAGFILKWLGRNPGIRLKNLVLVAPWLDPQRECGDFLDCTLDPDLAGRLEKMHVFYSSDDPTEGVAETKDIILQTYAAARPHLFEGKGHFCHDDLRGPVFHELWDVCKTA